MEYYVFSYIAPDGYYCVGEGGSFFMIGRSFCRFDCSIPYEMYSTVALSRAACRK